MGYSEFSAVTPLVSLSSFVNMCATLCCAYDKCELQFYFSIIVIYVRCMSPVQVPSVLGVLTLSKSDIHLSHVQKFGTCFTDNLHYRCPINAVQENNGQKLSTIAILLQSKTQQYQPPNYKYIKQQATCFGCSGPSSGQTRTKSWYIECAHSVGSHIVYIINHSECHIQVDVLKQREINSQTLKSII